MFNIKNYLARHLQASLNSLGQLSRTPIASFITCFVIGITLTLPTILFVALKNVENVRGNFQQTTQMTVYLKKNTTEQQTHELLLTLQNKPFITKAYAISPSEGLNELQQQTGFKGALEELQENPLPWTIVIIPQANNSPALESFTKTLEQLPLVDNVQMDMLWVKRLGTLIDLAQRIVIALTLFLGTALLLIVNNTIRSATQSNQKEIEVIQLIGGTDAFIRRPFLYAGIFYGLFGGIIASQLVDLFLLSLNHPANHLAALYHTAFQLTGLNVTNILALLSGSMLLGLIGSWLAVTRHLRS